MSFCPDCQRLVSHGPGCPGEDPRPRIVFEHVYPPIPIRCYDWSATLEGYEGPDSDGVGGDPIGRGATKEAAEADLLDQLAEQEEA